MNFAANQVYPFLPWRPAERSKFKLRTGKLENIKYTLYTMQFTLCTEQLIYTSALSKLRESAEIAAVNGIVFQ